MTDQEITENIQHYFQMLKTNQTDPITLYLQGLAPSGRRSMRSLLQSAADIMEYEGALERMPWPLLQHHHIANIRYALQQNNKSASTINLTLSALRGVMKASFNLGLIKADQLMKINEIKRVRGTKLLSGRSLTERETKALLAVCKKDKTVMGKRDLAVIVLMLATGLRRSEVVALTMSDYNSRNGELMVMSGKGNKQRMIYLHTNARRMIKPWLDCRGRAEGALFYPVNEQGIRVRVMNHQSIYDLIQKRATQANIEHCSPHDFRRTFVTRLLESGIDINTVRQLAGHTDIQTTARYDLRDAKLQKQVMKNMHWLV